MILGQVARSAAILAQVLIKSSTVELASPLRVPTVCMADPSGDASGFISRLFEAIWDDADEAEEASLATRPIVDEAEGPSMATRPTADEAERPSLATRPIVDEAEGPSPSLVTTAIADAAEGLSLPQGPITDEAEGLSLAAGPDADEAEGPSLAAGPIADEAEGPSLATRPHALGSSSPRGVALATSSGGASSASASVGGSTASSLVGLLDMGPSMRALHYADHFWWHGLVHSGLRQQIACYNGIVWKMPQRVEDPFTHCMSLLGRLVRNDCCYYVGITESPIRRWEAHARKYTTMYLVYVAETSRTTAALEMAVLNKVAFGSLKCENDSRGGEAASSGSPHYLYVAARESGLMRGNYREPKRSRLRTADVMEEIRGWGG